MSVVPPSSPRTFAQFVLDALAEQRWMEVARLADPADLERFRRLQLHFLHISDRAATTPPPVEEIQRQNPGMPTAVAEHYAETSRDHHAQYLRQTYAGIGSVGELEALSPAEMLGRFLQAHAQRWVPTDVQMEEPPHERRRIIGEVAEDESLVHVLYRWALYQGRRRVGPEQIAVVSLRRTAEGWRLRLTGELFGAALLGPELPESENAQPSDS